MSRMRFRLTIGWLAAAVLLGAGCSSRHDEDEYVERKPAKPRLVDVDVDTIDQNWHIVVDSDDYEDWRVWVGEEKSGKNYADVKVDD